MTGGEAQVRLEAARQEAVRAIADNLYPHLGEQTTDYEVEIGPHEVVSMLDSTLSTLEAHGLLRDRVAMTPPDISEIVNSHVSLLDKLSLIEQEE